jgi:hypothetical protein
MGLMLSLPMQAMIYGLLERAIGVFICGSFVAIIVSNLGFLRLQKSVQTSTVAAAAAAVTTIVGNPSRSKSLLAGYIPCGSDKGDEEMFLVATSDDDESPRTVMTDGFWDERSFDPSEATLERMTCLLPSIDEEIDEEMGYYNNNSFETSDEAEELDLLFAQDSPLDEHFECDRAIFEAKAKQASREDLLEMGESLFVLGDMLYSSGKRKDALEVFERAAFVQKLAVERVMASMAASMRNLGVYHRDRGDDYLSVVLVGAAELLQARPTASCLKLCTLVHSGYTRSCGTCPELAALLDEMDQHLELVRREAKPLALTLRGQANCYSQ